MLSNACPIADPTTSAAPFPGEAHAAVARAALAGTPRPDSHRIVDLEHLGESLPDRRSWSPERTLAATVLIDALMHVRERYGDASVRHQVDQDLRWIKSNDTRWPFSFVSLCDGLGLEPGSVRAEVRRWIRDAISRGSAVANGRQRPGAKIVVLGRTRRR